MTGNDCSFLNGDEGLHFLEVPNYIVKFCNVYSFSSLATTQGRAVQWIFYLFFIEDHLFPLVTNVFALL